MFPENILGQLHFASRVILRQYIVPKIDFINERQKKTEDSHSIKKYYAIFPRLS